ncbi:hypothetical protein C7967_10812 [Thalassospira sp. 11-3]|jgi:hypothetical protein|nr:hypothetical protein KO164_4082 [Thalassospira sp. KO164]PXX29349.1 hypothetical protein C7967_10812 [Thalassospira sp. 11-3]SEE84773.1 hypothetical protein SAMN04515623_4134 [Thalassospira permensis]
MAAAGQDPSLVDRWGPCARGASGLHRLPEVPPWQGVTGAGRGPEGRHLGRTADARGASGLHRLPEMSPWPGVTGAGRGPEGRHLARTADARGASGLHRLPEVPPWPEVMGLGGEPEGRQLARMADARRLSGGAWRVNAFGHDAIAPRQSWSGNRHGLSTAGFPITNIPVTGCSATARNAFKCGQVSG